MSQKEQKHQFNIGGEHISISKKDAEYKLGTIKEWEEPKKYYVKYRRKEVPVKQALNAVEPKLMRAGFNTTVAVGLFKKLGFKVGAK